MWGAIDLLRKCFDTNGCVLKNMYCEIISFAFSRTPCFLRKGMTSFLEKMATTREAWLAKLDGININRVDMNKLIMNYLVTGKV